MTERNNISFMDHLGEFHFKFSKGDNMGQKKIVAIDTEWAKNWRAEEKVVPFCCSFHTIYLEGIKDIIDIDNVSMSSETYFRSREDSIQDYIDKVDLLVSRYMTEGTAFVGHQLSSDLHTFVQQSKKPLKNIPCLIESLRFRKKSDKAATFSMFDTRYDIKNRIRGGGGEKLRNVSLRYKVYAIQNELNNTSLTKMYNQYVIDRDVTKREKLTVMNWRHSFQTALVYLIDIYPKNPIYNKKFDGEFLVTNDIILEMGGNTFGYLSSEEYLRSCTLEGIEEYIKKYSQII